MAPSWSDLPSELLGAVLLHLRCLADRVYFAAVCRSWRSAAAARAIPLSATAPPQFPWLLLLPSTNAPCFVSLLAGSARRRLSLPHGASGARLCGSHAGGWLAVAADGWRACALVNVFSRARVPLPDRLRVPRHGITTCLVVRAVALSAPPTSRGCIAAALVCGVSNLAFVRPGMDRHWLASETVHGLQDVLYHDGEGVGGFHAVNNDGAVTVFVQEGVPGAPDLRMALRSYRMQRRPNAPPPNYPSSPAGVSRYLMESRGKLLMVVRHFPSVVQHGSGVRGLGAGGAGSARWPPRGVLGGARRRPRRARALPRARLLQAVRGVAVRRVARGHLLLGRHRLRRLLGAVERRQFPVQRHRLVLGPRDRAWDQGLPVRVPVDFLLTDLVLPLI